MESKESATNYRLKASKQESKHQRLWRPVKAKSKKHVRAKHQPVVQKRKSKVMKVPSISSFRGATMCVSIINTVNVNWASFVVDRETIVLVDPHFLLLGIADGEVGNVLLAVDIRAGRVRHTTENTSFERNVSLLRELELAGYRAANGHGIPS